MEYMKRSLVVILLGLAVFQLAACGAPEDSAKKEEPAHVEAVEGSEFNRVTLTERAAERLGIETAPVRSMEVTTEETVGGQVVLQQGEVTDPSEGIVRVSLDKSIVGRVDDKQPVRVLLQDDDDEDEGFMAELFEGPDSDDPEDTDEAGDDDMYFVVDSVRNSLVGGQPVFVKLTLTGTMTEQMVIPYSAVIYGLNGETWTYTNPESLIYVRQPITVERIEGGLAYLSDGPPPGTEVVTIGAALLYGADTGVGK